MGGRGEIRPHNLKGIRGALGQLKGVRSRTHRILITYLPVDTAGRPQDAGRPHKILVLMTIVPRPDITAEQLLAEPWYRISEFDPPDIINVDYYNKGLVGTAVEPVVRDIFRRSVLVPSGRTIRGGTGGHRIGSDVIWHELAEFYGELSRQSRDPFYAELASELAASLR